jgi:adenylylsulfate kinase-like enzyme
VSDRVPVLWLCGPPGVGKSTVGWELFTGLAATGVRTGYVDIDQLGMCFAPAVPDNVFPEPGSDYGRHRMKTRNLGAVVTNFRAAGARCVIVSGVTDAGRGVDRALIPDASLTVCRLRVDPGELSRRLVGRRRPGDSVEAALREAGALDRGAATDLCLDTTGRTVADVVEMLRRHVAVAPAPPAGPLDPVPVPGRILWLCGVTGVGKSTVGWRLYERLNRAGTHAAFVDLQQIGFCRPGSAHDTGNHRLKARNLAAMWRTFRARGARRLIVVGQVDDPDHVRRYTAALPGITLYRLHASQEFLTERILLRGQGMGPQIAGDDLRDQPEPVLRQIARAAAADADALHRAGLGDVRIDTDGRTTDETAQAILTHSLKDGPLYTS